MAVRLPRWLAAYDVSHDPSRSAVARLLEAHGQRVQYSVFEIAVSAADCERILAAASQHLRGNDSLLLLRHCSHCAIVRVGPALDGDKNVGWIVS